MSILQKNTYEELENRVQELERAEEDHQFALKEHLIILEVLELINETEKLEDLIDSILVRLKKWSGCEAVGIRLKEGPDFPYFATSGFPEQFVQSENHLCSYGENGEVARGADGNPLLECMCGNIICGRFDPSKNFFTSDGSFWSNCTTQLLATTTDADRQARTRNRCNSTGYESVSLIPLRSAAETFGLIQLNDHRKDRFTPDLIAMYRRIANYVAGFLAKRQALESHLKAEEALRESEKRYRELFENSTDFVYTLDLKGNFTDVNKTAEDLTGYTRNELIGMNYKDFTPPVTHEQIFSAIKSIIINRGKPLKDFPLETTIKNGAKKYFEACVSVLTKGEEVIGFQGSSRDVTHRKNAEKALRYSLEKYEKTFQSAPVWVALSTLEDGIYIEVNESFLETMGYEREEVIGKSAIELETWCNLQDRDNIKTRIKEKGGVRNVDVQRRTRSGEIIDTLMSVELLVLEGEQMMVSVIQDISDRKRAEAEREKLQNQLIQAQKMESVGRLAGGVAHDFNNMLSVIIGQSELALDGLAPEDRLHSRLKEILNAAIRSANITRQLLAFARKQTVSPKVINLNNTIENMLKMLRRLIGEEIDLVWRPRSRLWPVKIDPSQIDQILANLCVNARDAIKNVGKITIETEIVSADEDYCRNHKAFVPGDYVMLIISDDGHGMDKETQENAFEPFFTTKKQGMGTGLGLSTVYGIVKQNSGFIYIYSELGKGTTFKIYFPRHTEQTQEVSEKIPVGVPSGRGETILLVEDEASIIRFCTDILESLGYRVFPVNSPNEAMEIAKKHTGLIDLLITDVVMPEMSGRDLADQLQSHFPDLKILFMSGYTADVIAHRGILEQDVNFLQKPFSKRDMAVKIRKALGKHKDDED